MPRYQESFFLPTPPLSPSSPNCGRRLGRTSTFLILVGGIVFATLVIPALVSCRVLPPPRPSVHFELVGSDSMQWIAKSLSAAYSDRRPDVAFNVRISNSAIGLTASQEFSRTIGMVSRTVKPEELESRRAISIALDGVAVIVSKSNPINSIMRSQVVQVFDGEVITWPTGAIAGQSIVVVSREEGSGTRDAFQTMVMKTLRVTRTAVVMPGEAAVVNFVEKHPEAIGYTSMGALTPKVHSLSVDGVGLNPHTVETLQYPFVRTLAFIVPLKPDPEMQEWLDFVLGPDGQAIIGQRFGRINP